MTETQKNVSSSAKKAAFPQIKSDLSARQKHLLFEQALELAPDATLLTDQAGKILHVNRQAETLFGYSRAELIGKPLENIMPRRFRTGHKKFRQQYSLNPVTRPMGSKGSFYGLHKNGGEFPVDISLSPYEIDGKIFISVAIRDYGDRQTERLRLEERLRFEELISNLSAKFINMAASRVDATIIEGLQEIVQFFEVDRSSFLQASEDHSRISLTHSYAVKGIEPVPSLNALKLFPVTMESVLGGDIFCFTSVKELDYLPENEREVFRRFGLKSHVSVPVMLDGVVQCILSIGAVRKERTWPEELFPRLRLIGEIFANALQRKNNEKKIRKLTELLEAENLYLREEIDLELDFEKIIGNSEALKYVLYRVQQVAPANTTVLIEGETGTGKELFAHAIHHASPRKNKPFIKVNCATLPANLIESELFGHEKGAFTGAAARRIGRFELAEGGTIFLDEIGELPLELQAKILRVLQEGEIERLGNPRPIKINVRVIAATNRELTREVQTGRFRKDLYYRLNVFSLSLPSLRERKEDIPLLVQVFVNRFSKKMGKTINTIPRKELQKLQDYSWPGNVRELENAIERAVIISPESALVIEMPAISPVEINEEQTLEAVERQHIIRTLDKTNWRIAGPRGAAEILGINVNTLRSRMQKLGITRPRLRHYK